MRYLPNPYIIKKNNFDPNLLSTEAILIYTLLHTSNERNFVSDDLQNCEIVELCL